MNAGTPDVVTVMEGAPICPTAPPAMPRRDPSSWPRSGCISWAWAWGPAGVVSGCGGVVVVAAEDAPEAEVVVEEEVEVVEEEVTVWAAVETKAKV